MTVHRPHQKGFTLIEIMIVVIILGILAAIIIPQFTNASTTAESSNILTQLQEIRTQLALYPSQHTPGVPAFNQMWNNLLVATNPDGTTTGTPQVGPYFPRAPINPFTGFSTVADGSASTAGSATIGWLYNANNGTIVASIPSAQAAVLGLTTNDVATY